MAGDARALFLLDSGAYTLKAGFAGDEGPSLIPNCVAKVKSERRRAFTGDQIDECKDYSGLFYLLPCFKGFVVNWELQRQVWSYVFNSKYALADPHDVRILTTEPYFNFRAVQENFLENLFEEFGFGAVRLTKPATLSAFKHTSERDVTAVACLVVDAGYSFTHVVPFVSGELVTSGIRRIDVGGKALTNRLKDMISYRQLHVLDETFVMNQCKEDSCFVSLDLEADLCECRLRDNAIAQDYVLPDYSVVKRGFVRKGTDERVAEQQVIRMNNERIQIPEMLFFPSDVGIDQIGVSHAIFHSVECQPEHVRPHLYKNIVLTGGSANFGGFRERIERDIRSLVDANYEVRVILPEDPVKESWFGGRLMGKSELGAPWIDRKTYEECGPSACLDKLV